MFFLVGIIPDAAAARDRAQEPVSPSCGSTIFSFGWTGANYQWKHFYGAYLFFAALATPLVLSGAQRRVVGLRDGAGPRLAQHDLRALLRRRARSSRASRMVINLLIPIRKGFKLEHIVTVDHIEKLAKLVLLTSTIVGYSYLVEFFCAWYGAEQVRARHLLVARDRPLLVGVLDHVHAAT